MAQPVVDGVLSRESGGVVPVGSAHVGMDGGDLVQHIEPVKHLDQDIDHCLAVFAAAQRSEVVVVSAQIRPRSQREIGPTESRAW
ncbi:hypothetical protein [Nocardia pseudovaccinii]|uniref:hypothetical protein n=1 Tax=Nocardia pseudovaccinii TaxID=189540 RepID=UPI0007A44B8A|nr:hypothetical protein [Nocardia pseudovaccinii]